MGPVGLSIMTLLLRLEQLILLLACYVTTLYLGYAWWLFFALWLLPDISMLGYTINGKWGAIMYNLFHHQGIAVLIIGTGWYIGRNDAVLIGLVIFGHSAMDRVFGYGLKHFSGFQDTHLGRIGK